jgi:hypothetical protein
VDADLCCRHYTQWCEGLRIEKIVGATSDSSFQGKAQPSVHAFEKDGQLQFLLCDMLSLIGDDI